MDLEKPQAIIQPHKINQQINNYEHKPPPGLYCIKIAVGLILPPTAHARLFCDQL